MGSYALPVEQGMISRPAIPNICIAALCVVSEHWEMKGILFSVDHVPAFAAAVNHCIKLYHAVLYEAQEPERCLVLIWQWS